MGFSRDARMRMLRLINKIHWKDVGKSTFITLTYPDTHITLGQTDRKKHRDQFFREVERDCGHAVPFLWKLEWQVRKSGEHVGTPAPHTHCMALGLPFIHHQVVRKLWRRIIKAKGPLATDVKAIKGEDGAARYMAKYVSKASSLDISAYRSNPKMRGRAWGLTRSNLVPMFAVSLLERLTEDQSELLRQYASENFKNYDVELGGGFTVFGRAHAIAVLGTLGKGD